MVYDKKKGLWRVFTSRQKTGTDVSVLLPEDVSAELLDVKKENQQYFFWDGNGEAILFGGKWSKYISTVFAKAFPIPEKHQDYCQCHPRNSHQLRDTFAVDLLSKGVPLEEVSKLLGHTSIKTTEKHYAAWVQSRQDRLDALVMGAWEYQQAGAGA
jgi:integrase/recombinase XerD